MHFPSTDVIVSPIFPMIDLDLALLHTIVCKFAFGTTLELLFVFFGYRMHWKQMSDSSSSAKSECRDRPCLSFNQHSSMFISAWAHVMPLVRNIGWWLTSITASLHCDLAWPCITAHSSKPRVLRTTFGHSGCCVVSKCSEDMVVAALYNDLGSLSSAPLI